MFAGPHFEGDEVAGVRALVDTEERTPATSASNRV